MTLPVRNVLPVAFASVSHVTSEIDEDGVIESKTEPARDASRLFSVATKCRFAGSKATEFSTCTETDAGFAASWEHGSAPTLLSTIDDPEWIKEQHVALVVMTKRAGRAAISTVFGSGLV